MNDEAETKRALREWVARANGKIRAEDLRDDTPIVEQRIITSLQVMDLILQIENLSGRSVDAEQLKPGAFHDINTIYQNFFREA